MNILMATGNKNKVREINEMLEGTKLKVISLKEAGIDIDIDENGKSFEENAIIKAEAIRDVAHEIVLADDSGLVIDALGGAPGIYSARYMGEDTSYDIKCNALLKELEEVPFDKRDARFVCSMAIAYPDGRPTQVFTGVFEGKIGYEIIGENGFGYDPIFFLPEYDMTSAQISPELKNEISHRAKALKQAVVELKKL